MKKHSVFFVCYLTAIFSAAVIFAQGFTGPNDPVSQVHITGERAKQIALVKTAGGTVIEMEWELKRGRAQYELEIINSGMKYEMKLDSATGEIIEYKEKRTSVREFPSPPQSQITFERAKEIALAGSSNALVEKISWEHKYGQYVYEVSVMQNRQKNKIYIDGMTGRILQPARRAWI